MSSFRPNRRVAQQLAAQPELRKALKDAAEPARERVEQLARQVSRWPVMPKTRRGQNLAVIEVDGRQVRIVLRGHGAHLVEWGSRNNPPYSPLRRGVRAAGLRFRAE